MCEFFSHEKIKLTKQGLDLRFTQDSVNFMKALYPEAFVMIEEERQITWQNLINIFLQEEINTYWRGRSLLLTHITQVVTQRFQNAF